MLRLTAHYDIHLFTVHCHEPCVAAPNNIVSPLRSRSLRIAATRATHPCPRRRHRRQHAAAFYLFRKYCRSSRLLVYVPPYSRAPIPQHLCHFSHFCISVVLRLAGAPTTPGNPFVPTAPAVGAGVGVARQHSTRHMHTDGATGGEKGGMLPLHRSFKSSCVR